MNTLNKIHYGVKIVTKSTKSSSTVGLLDGVLRYTTDGYTPTPGVDKYEDNSLVEGGWNTDLMHSNGFGRMGYKIDIISGGDYAFLQSITIDLVNYTDSGQPLHNTFSNISELSILGGSMQAYVIIDGVWYPRWSGQVGAKKFSDNKFTIIGEDLKSNSTDTLKETIFGLVNSDTDYNLEGDVIYGNLLTYRLNDVERMELLPLPHSANVIDVMRNGTDAGTNPDYVKERVAFNGIGMVHHSVTGNVRNYAYPTTISFIRDNNPENIERGDIVKYSEGGIAIITHKGTKTEGATESIVLTLSWIEGAQDYTILFGDPENKYHGQVHDSMESIATTKHFSIYKLAENAGIALENASSTGTIELLNDGLTYEFPYMLNPNGRITITHHNSSHVIKPISVGYHASPTDLFGPDTGRTWDEYSNINWRMINLPNNLNNSDTWFETDREKYQYFRLKFRTSDVNKLTTPQLGVLVRGMYDNDGQAWESEDNIQEANHSWYYCNQADYTHNIIPTYPSKLYHTTPNIAGLASEQSRGYVFEQYQLVEDLTHGIIPRATGLITIPQLIDNLNTVTLDSTGLPGRMSFLSTSQPATNVPGYKNYIDTNKTYCVYDGLQHVTTNTYDPQQPNKGRYYPTATVDDGKKDDGSLVKLYVDGEYTYVLTMISASKENVTLRMYSHADTPSTFYMNDSKMVKLKVNSLVLFNVYDITSETSVSYKHVNESASTNNIVDLLKDVSGGTGIYTAVEGTRDGWDAGLQIKEQQQRYNVVTRICKQSFIGGYTSRFGNDTYKQVGTFDDLHPVGINDNIIVDRSIKNFSTSLSAKVYNEYSMEGDNISKISIRNVDKDAFPPYGSDYVDYVEGEDNYEIAKAYWKKAHQAFVVTNVIHKAPSDRTKLEFAYGTYTEEINYLSHYTSNSSGTLTSTSGNLTIGSHVVISPTVVGFISGVRVVFKTADNVIRVTVMMTSDTEGDVESLYLPGAVSSIVWSSATSYFVEPLITDSSIYVHEYLSKMLDWTSYPKLQVSIKLPITVETIKYELLDSVLFSDPIITPELGEYGKGWITSYKLNPSKNIIDIELTFEPAFYIIPSYYTDPCHWINEEKDNVDWIEEKSTNTDFINEELCSPF